MVFLHITDITANANNMEPGLPTSFQEISGELLRRGGVGWQFWRIEQSLIKIIWSELACDIVPKTPTFAN